MATPRAVSNCQRSVIVARTLRCGSSYWGQTGSGTDDFARPIEGTPSDINQLTEYQYNPAGQEQSQTALNTVSYSVTAESVSTHLPLNTASPNTYLMYSVQDLGTRWGSAATGAHFVVVQGVQDGPDWVWSYDNGTSMVPFTPCPTDVLVATIDMSGATPAIAVIGQQGAQDDTFNGIVDGYSSANSTFGFSMSGNVVIVDAGTLVALAPQVTRYYYAADVYAFDPSAEPAGWTGDQLVATVYPDCTLSNAAVLGDVEANIASPGVLTGGTAGNDIVADTYYANGAKATETDQRGVVHQYIYDNLGRETEDDVTSLGLADQHVDGSVQAIVTAYNDGGQTASITSYDSPTARASTDVVNQIVYQFSSIPAISGHGKASYRASYCVILYP